MKATPPCLQQSLTTNALILDQETCSEQGNVTTGETIPSDEPKAELEIELDDREDGDD
jgi:hypothetical protein